MQDNKCSRKYFRLHFFAEFFLNGIPYYCCSKYKFLRNEKIYPVFVLCFFIQTAFAAYVPVNQSTKAVSPTNQMNNLVRELSAEEFQQVTGKKFSRLQKWQYNRLHRKLNSKNAAFIPERDELTEGFQALPFFGSLLTFGLVYLVMLFTAQDRNALRWAGLGFTVAALIVSAAALIGSLSGY
jgi:hypothetical protein